MSTKNLSYYERFFFDKGSESKATYRQVGKKNGLKNK